jgi:ABC-type transport system substrate-binding protein
MLTSPAWNPKTPELLSEYLREVGIKIRINSLDQTAAQTAATEARYELALLGYGMASDPDRLRSSVSSKSTSRSFAKVHGDVNPRFDELAAQQLGQLDTAQRTQTAHEMQRILAEDVVTLPLYVATRTVIFDKTVIPDWYYTVGGGPAYPGMLNKLIFVTDKRTGF